MTFKDDETSVIKSALNYASTRSRGIAKAANSITQAQSFVFFKYLWPNLTNDQKKRAIAGIQCNREYMQAIEVIETGTKPIVLTHAPYKDYNQSADEVRSHAEKMNGDLKNYLHGEMYFYEKSQFEVDVQRMVWYRLGGDNKPPNHGNLLCINGHDKKGNPAALVLDDNCGKEDGPLGGEYTDRTRRLGTENLEKIGSVAVNGDGNIVPALKGGDFKNVQTMLRRQNPPSPTNDLSRSRTASNSDIDKDSSERGGPKETNRRSPGILNRPPQVRYRSRSRTSRWNQSHPRRTRNEKKRSQDSNRKPATQEVLDLVARNVRCDRDEICNGTIKHKAGEIITGLIKFLEKKYSSNRQSIFGPSQKAVNRGKKKLERLRTFQYSCTRRNISPPELIAILVEVKLIAGIQTGVTVPKTQSEHLFDKLSKQHSKGVPTFSDFMKTVNQVEPTAEIKQRIQNIEPTFSIPDRIDPPF